MDRPTRQRGRAWFLSALARRANGGHGPYGVFRPHGRGGMSSPRFATHRPRPRPASDFAGAAKLTDPARALLAHVDDPGAYVVQLIVKRLYPDAIRFTAHRLPRA